jgi:hypothetical protein
MVVIAAIYNVSDLSDNVGFAQLPTLLQEGRATFFTGYY